MIVCGDVLPNVANSVRRYRMMRCSVRQVCSCGATLAVSETTLDGKQGLKAHRWVMLLGLEVVSLHALFKHYQGTKCT